jgi:PPOX class probable F420-dependent enzyme
MTVEAAIDQSQQQKLDAFLSQPILARLATAGDAQPHVVPVWYLWDGESVWISSYSSTRKIRELRKNPRCAVIVDTQEAINGVTAVLLEGQAELLTAPLDFVRSMATRIYTKYLGPEGVLAAEPQEWIHSPEQTIIRLTPTRTVHW